MLCVLKQPTRAGFDVPFTPDLDVDVVGCVDGYEFSVVCIGVSVDVDVSNCDYKWFLLVSVLSWVNDDESCFLKEIE
jgi:hypothetical protein